ncbi:hypothetical protein GALL_512500 [mine drainage metagenome]|uniref:Uncharacterized protein n=1 Tax=mine drainage metagenome TaxID=410659 RepID=A0A1J5P8V1_9ZZZZ
MQDEEVDELGGCSGFAVQIDLLMKQGDLTDLFSVIEDGEDRAALTEAALVEPFHPLRGKNRFLRSERLGRNTGRDFVVDRILFRNRNHQAGLPRCAPIRSIFLCQHSPKRISCEGEMQPPSDMRRNCRRSITCLCYLSVPRYAIRSLRFCDSAIPENGMRLPGTNFCGSVR